MTPVENVDQIGDEESGREVSVDDAREYVRQLRAFFIHAGVFGAGMVVIFVVNLITNLSAGIAGELRAWWFIWALLGWGAGINVHGLVVRLNRPSPSSSKWEQQQMDKVLST